jgi:hypothetical protein
MPSAGYPNTTSSSLTHNNDQQQHEDTWAATLETEEVDWTSQALEDSNPHFSDSATIFNDVVSKSSHLQRLSDQEDAWVACMDSLNIDWEIVPKNGHDDICATCWDLFGESLLTDEESYEQLAEIVLIIYQRPNQLIPFIRDPIGRLADLADESGCCLKRAMEVLWNRATQCSRIIWPWTVDEKAARPWEQEIILPVIQIAHEIGGVEVDKWWEDPPGYVIGMLGGGYSTEYMHAAICRLITCSDISLPWNVEPHVLPQLLRDIEQMYFSWDLLPEEREELRAVAEWACARGGKDLEDFKADPIGFAVPEVNDRRREAFEREAEEEAIRAEEEAIRAENEALDEEDDHSSNHQADEDDEENTEEPIDRYAFRVIDEETDGHERDDGLEEVDMIYITPSRNASLDEHGTVPWDLGPNVDPLVELTLRLTYEHAWEEGGAMLENFERDPISFTLQAERYGLDHWSLRLPG